MLSWHKSNVYLLMYVCPKNVTLNQVQLKEKDVCTATSWTRVERTGSHWLGQDGQYSSSICKK